MHSKQPPILSLSTLQRAFSQQRIESYRHAADRDEVDTVARYLWNMALCCSLHSVLHVFEITFRNAIYHASVKLIDTSKLHMPDIPCWLDAQGSTLLYADEVAEVKRAKTCLSSDPKRRTPGHLIAKLSFGFWVQLTARVYNELRADGPKLWPRGLPHAFPNKWPLGSKKIVPGHADREMIFNRVHEIRKLRNRIAHHEPVWELDLEAQHHGILEILGWMNSKMVAAVNALDMFPSVLAGGAESYRGDAERLMRGVPA